MEFFTLNFCAKNREFDSKLGKEKKINEFFPENFFDFFRFFVAFSIRNIPSNWVQNIKSVFSKLNFWTKFGKQQQSSIYQSVILFDTNHQNHRKLLDQEE